MFAKPILRVFNFLFVGADFWPRLVWALAMPLLLLAPLFSTQIGLATGPLAAELWMGRGIRAAMNAALLNGEFPLWNPWLSAGSVAHIFGSLPFNIFTPLELIFAGKIPSRLIVFETFLVHAFLSIVFQFTLRAYKVSAWVVGLAFLFMMLVDPVWVSAHVPWWMGTITMVYPVILLALLFFLFERRKRQSFCALTLGLVSSLLLFFGAKTEVVYMFPIYLLVFCLCHFFIQRLYGFKISIKNLFRSKYLKVLFAFGVLPVFIFLWQLPLVFSLFKIAEDRLSQKAWLWGPALEYFIFSFYFSHAVQAIFVFSLIVLLANILANCFARIFKIQKFAEYFQLFFLTFFFLIALLFLTRFNHPSPSTEYENYEPTWMAIGFLLGLFHWIFNGGNIISKHFFRWALFLGGMIAIFLEGQLLTVTNPMPGGLFSALTFLMTLGMFGNKKTGILASNRFRALLLSLIIAGWVLRDFLPVPIFYLTNLLYVNPRDYFWIITSVGLLTASGLAQLESIVTPQFIKTIDDPKAILPNPQHLLLHALTIVIFFGTVWFAGTRFRLPQGEVSDNLIWKNYSETESKKLDAYHEFYISHYNAVKEKNKGFARVLTMENTFLGLSGVDIDHDIFEAWNYGYLGKQYRQAAEPIFRNDSYYLNPIPRIFYYGSNNQRMMSDTKLPRKFTTPINFNKAYDFYKLDNCLEQSTKIDPFFLELMRVGLIWSFTFEGPKPLAPHPQLIPLPVQDMFAYQFSPTRSLERFGVLPEDSPATQFLASEKREEMQALYKEILLTPKEQEADGITVKKVTWGINQISINANVKKPARFMVFDSWHPDWTAKINGQATPIERTLRNFRAIKVPAGNDLKIEMIFAPPYLWPALLASCLSVLLVIFIIWRGRHYF